jgi:hypothetical protein
MEDKRLQMKGNLNVITYKTTLKFKNGKGFDYIMEEYCVIRSWSNIFMNGRHNLNILYKENNLKFVKSSIVMNGRLYKWKRTST